MTGPGRDRLGGCRERACSAVPGTEVRALDKAREAPALLSGRIGPVSVQLTVAAHQVGTVFRQPLEEQPADVAP